MSGLRVAGMIVLLLMFGFAFLGILLGRLADSVAY